MQAALASNRPAPLEQTAELLGVIHDCFFRYCELRIETGCSEIHLSGLLNFRMELRERYYDEILRRCLLPLVFSLRSEYVGDDDILEGGERLDLSLEWHGCNSPKDRSTVQFFETVGLHLKGSEGDHNSIFADGEVRRAIERGKYGTVTSDEGNATQLGDIGALFLWLEASEHRRPLSSVG